MTRSTLRNYVPDPKTLATVRDRAAQESEKIAADPELKEGLAGLREWVDEAETPAPAEAPASEQRVYVAPAPPPESPSVDVPPERVHIKRGFDPRHLTTELTSRRPPSPEHVALEDELPLNRRSRLTTVTIVAAALALLGGAVLLVRRAPDAPLATDAPSGAAVAPSAPAPEAPSPAVDSATPAPRVEASAKAEPSASADAEASAARPAAKAGAPAKPLEARGRVGDGAATQAPPAPVTPSAIPAAPVVSTPPANPDTPGHGPIF